MAEGVVLSYDFDIILLKGRTGHVHCKYACLPATQLALMWMWCEENKGPAVTRSWGM